MSIANELERYMLELINQERTSRGLDALVLETNLNEAAEVHSQWMTDTDTFSHTGENNSSPTARMTEAEMDLSGAWGTAENIAAVSVQGQDSYFDEVDQLHTNLMNSDGHRANILDPDLDYIGIGIVTGPLTYNSTNGPITLNSVLVTQNFARTQGVSDLDLGGNNGNDVITGLDGDDVITSLGGSDSVSAEGGNDSISSGSGNDTLDGGSGNDTLKGGTGQDELDGGTGHDSLSGQGSADTLNGGDGRDILRGGGGDDVLNGDSGNDTVIGGGRQDTVDGGTGDDTISGNAREDVLNGGEGEDMLRGGGHADTLDGGTGDDVLRGGDGDDDLTGGADNDRLVGGSGQDRFFFDVDHGDDSIRDLEIGIDILSISADLAMGRDAATLVSLGTVVDGDLVLSLEAESSITLENITSTAGLAEMIEII